jgi:hypothetical protein
MDQYNTQSNQTHSNHSGSTKSFSVAKPLAVVILLIVFALVGFYGGIHYEKDHDKSAIASTNSPFGGYASGGYGSRFSGQRPVFGSVTSVSPTSISIQDSQTGTTVTLSITSSTTITDNGQSSTVSTIQPGETVAAMASSSDSSQASRILINPSYGGGSDNTNPTSSSIE